MMNKDQEIFLRHLTDALESEKNARQSLPAYIRAAKVFLVRYLDDTETGRDLNRAKAIADFIHVMEDISALEEQQTVSEMQIERPPNPITEYRAKKV